MARSSFVAVFIFLNDTAGNITTQAWHAKSSVQCAAMRGNVCYEAERFGERRARAVGRFGTALTARPFDLKLYVTGYRTMLRRC